VNLTPPTPLPYQGRGETAPAPQTRVSPPSLIGKGGWGVRSRRTTLTALLLLAPLLVGLLVFRVWPIAAAVRTSLFDVNLLSGAERFVGAFQYARLWADPVFWASMQATGLLVALKLPLQTALGLALALALQQLRPVQVFVRSAVFLPVVTAYVVAAAIWNLIYHPSQGLLNSLIGGVGLPRQGFLVDINTALPALVWVTIWKDVGFSMIVLLAGLQAIPAAVYEAAALDGAGRWTMLRSITLPLLRRPLLFVVVMTTIFTFQLYTPVYMLTQGGPGDSTRSIVYYIYQNGFLYNDLGYASALSIVLLGLILVISVFQLRVLRSDVEY